MEQTQTDALSIIANIGFNIQTASCMIVHPSDLHFIWATGPLIVIKSIDKP